MRAINVLLAVVVSLGIGLLVLEGGLRLLGFGPPETLNEFHEKYGWRKRAEAVVERSTPEFEVTFRTNSRGLRDDEISLEKPAGEYRVVALGDSFVLGFTVDREDLFVDELESLWRREGRHVEVVNGGTEGYSTDQEVLWFLEEGVHYRPDLVLLFPYLNDVYWNGEARYNRFPKPLFSPAGELESGVLQDPGPGRVLDRFAVTRNPLVRRLWDRRRTDDVLFTPAGASGPILKELAPLLVEPPAFLDPALERTRGALLALKRSTEGLGARLAIVPIPPEAAIHADERERWQTDGRILASVAPAAWDSDRPVELFLALARELGIEALDPRPALLAAAEGGERLYFEKEWHLTPEGNRALATFLHDELDRRAVLPADQRALVAATIPARRAAGGPPTWLYVFAGLWLALAAGYKTTYREEPVWRAALGVGALLACVFALVLGGGALVELLPDRVARVVLVLFVVGVLGFVGYKLGRRLAIIAELLKAFVLRGHWYLMPLVVVLLTIGSLLVVAATSPFVAPFIYTLF